MKWSKQYNEILVRALPRYQAAKKGDARDDIVRETKREIKDYAKENDLTAQAGLTERIINWFHNHRKAKEDDDSLKPPKHVKKWTLRNVVREKMAKDIIDRAKELAEKVGHNKTSSRGNLDYLPFHPRAWTEIVDELDDDTREEYLDLVDEWNNSSVPPSVQQKKANREFAATASKFMEEVQQQMGVKLFILAGYRDVDGKIARVKFESAARPADRFMQTFSDEGRDVWEAWEKHLGDVYAGDDEEDEDDDSDGGSHRKKKNGVKPADKSIPCPLEVDRQEWPILPLDHDGLDLKDLMRSFVTLTYRRMANNSKCAVPWGTIFSHQNDYIDPIYLAPGVKIREPSKMVVVDLLALYNFWRRRQTKGEPVLRFKKVNEIHTRVPIGKRLKNLDWSEMPWVDVESESGGEAVARSKKSKGKGRADGRDHLRRKVDVSAPPAASSSKKSKGEKSRKKMRRSDFELWDDSTAAGNVRKKKTVSKEAGPSKKSSLDVGGKGLVPTKKPRPKPTPRTVFEEPAEDYGETRRRVVSGRPVSAETRKIPDNPSELQDAGAVTPHTLQPNLPETPSGKKRPVEDEDVGGPISAETRKIPDNPSELKDANPVTPHDLQANLPETPSGKKRPVDDEDAGGPEKKRARRGEKAAQGRGNVGAEEQARATKAKTRMGKQQEEEKNKRSLRPRGVK